MTQRQPLPERLHDLARKTEQRIGNHPEANLCREAASYILELEEKIEKLTAERAPAKTSARSTKKD